MKRTFLILISGALISGFLPGCSSKEQPAQEEVTAGEATEAAESHAASPDRQMAEKIWNIKENFFAGGLKWSVAGVKTNARFKGQGTKSASLSGTDAGGLGTTADAMLVSISVENPDDRPQTIQPSMFQLQDAQGNTYQPSLNGKALFNMKDFPVFEGITLEGKAAPVIITLAFEVPEGPTYDLLINTGGSKAERVRLEM